MRWNHRSSASNTTSIIGLGAVLLALSAVACGVEPGADPDENKPGVEATAGALTSGGGGGGTNYTCDDDGGCSCLGGSLSQDCWLLSQYCVDRFSCSPYPPYRCDCHWKLMRSPKPGVRVPIGGTLSTAAKLSTAP